MCLLLNVNRPKNNVLTNSLDLFIIRVNKKFFDSEHVPKHLDLYDSQKKQADYFSAVDVNAACDAWTLSRGCEGRARSAYDFYTSERRAS